MSIYDRPRLPHKDCPDIIRKVKKDGYNDVEIDYICSHSKIKSRCVIVVANVTKSGGKEKHRDGSMNQMKVITAEYLRKHPDHIFVYGDNLMRVGRGGGAELRDAINTYGFITKKRPDNRLDSFYTPSEYAPVFGRELIKLERLIMANPHKTFLISKIGSGLANKHRIFENIIEHRIKMTLEKYSNVEFLW